MTDVRAGISRRVDDLRAARDPAAGALGVALDVLAQNSEQPARLGERVARGRSDRLEAAASVGGQLRRREPGRLALHGDHRQVMRDDVVELARDRRAPPSRLLATLSAIAACVSSRAVTASLRWLDSPASAAATTSRNGPMLARSTPSPSNGTIALTKKRKRRGLATRSPALARQDARSCRAGLRER